MDTVRNLSNAERAAPVAERTLPITLRHGHLRRCLSARDSMEAHDRGECDEWQVSVAERSRTAASGDLDCAESPNDRGAVVHFRASTPGGAAAPAADRSTFRCRTLCPSALRG